MFIWKDRLNHFYCCKEKSFWWLYGKIYWEICWSTFRRFVYGSWFFIISALWFIFVYRLRDLQVIIFVFQDLDSCFSKIHSSIDIWLCFISHFPLLFANFGSIRANCLDWRFWEEVFLYFLYYLLVVVELFHIFSWLCVIFMSELNSFKPASFISISTIFIYEANQLISKYELFIWR